MDNPLLGATTPANNDFAYDAGHDPNDGFTPGNADAAGVICPAAAHIRKVNPRDLPTDQGIAPRTLLRRILRRGIPYGRPLPLGSTEDPDNADRGLLFLSYQSSIREQFEFTVRSWANDPAKPAQNGPPEGFGFDLILGQNPRSDRSRFLLLGPSRLPVNTGTAEWVRSTGGGYFFAPSRHALQNVLTVGD
jgi:deferrochelatase/peroxidase EfeB